MPPVGARQIEVPTRTVNAPRYGGQSSRFESWDLSVAALGGDLWLSHTALADAKGKGLAEITGIFRRAAPLVIRAPAPDPHLALAPVYSAGFERDRGVVFSLDEASPALVAGRGIDHLGAPLATGTGEAGFGEGFASGWLAEGEHRIEWDLKWRPGGSGENFVPPGPWPFRAVRYQVATRNPGVEVTGRIRVDGAETALDSVPGVQTHAWGTNYPKAFMTAICGRWARDTLVTDLLRDTRSVSDSEPAGSRRGVTRGVNGNVAGGPGNVSVGLLWLRGGAWGALGPPVPKTFGWMRVGGALVAFNALPQALSAGTHVRWPAWEARLIGRDVKADVRISSEPDSLTQIERRDPSGRRVWHSFTGGARIDVAVERRVGRSWIPAGSLESDSCRLNFGGRSPEPRIAVSD